jgi:hypothetical protein
MVPLFSNLIRILLGFGGLICLTLGSLIIWSKSDTTGAGILVFVGLALTVLGLVGHRVSSAKLPGGTEIVLAELLRASNELEKSGKEEGAALLRDAADLVDEAAPRVATTSPAIGLTGLRARVYESEVLKTLERAFPSLKKEIRLHHVQFDAMFDSAGTNYLVEIVLRLTVERLWSIRARLEIVAEEMTKELGKRTEAVIIAKESSDAALFMNGRMPLRIVVWEPSEGPDALLDRLKPSDGA